MIWLFTWMMAGNALAQDGGFDAHGFRLVAYDADLRDSLSLQRPGAFERGSWFGGALLEYAKAPLVLQSGLTGERQVLLDNVFTANTSVGWALAPNVRLDLSTPLYLASQGSSGAQGLGLGDMRLAMMGAFQIKEEGGDAWGVGLVPHLDLPTGNTGEFLGQTKFSGGLTGALTREMSDLTLTGNLGLQINPQVEVRNISGADTLLFGVGGGYLLSEKTSANLEFRSNWAVAASGSPGANSPGELIASVRHQADQGPFLTGGLATAATTGVGAAAFRLMVGGGWGQADATDRDADDDGLVDRVDGCPDSPETDNDYLDADGCPDELPRLRISVFHDGIGMHDAQLVIHQDDEVYVTDSPDLPMVVESLPGVSWSAAATFGDCLAGRVSTIMADGENEMDVVLEPTHGILMRVKFMDVDGVPVNDVQAEIDSEDAACSNAGALEVGEHGSASVYVGAGQHRVRVKGPGYVDGSEELEVFEGEEPVLEVVVQRVSEPLSAPVGDEATVRVRIEPTRIAILEPIHFTVGHAALKVVSYPLLDEMAYLINNTPQVGIVTVSGHTDSDGSESSNQRLSQSRAQAVVDYLTRVGVPKNRLATKGYGESQPIAPNRTEGGRALNRRVSFDLEPT